MRISRRSFPIPLLIMGILATAITTVPGSPPAVSAAPTDPKSTDPMSDVAPILMVCTSGQVDINHASVGELVAAFDLGDSFSMGVPAAERLIQHRPYLQVTDLKIVPGVGVDELKVIESAGIACATPLTEPPPVSDTCSEGQLDFNTATTDEIIAAWVGHSGVPKLARPIAQRITTEAPYLKLTDLIRVEGVDGPKVNHVLEVGCLSPHPVATGTEDAPTLWHFGTNVGGAYPKMGENSEYAMAIPPGVIADEAWVSINPDEASQLMIQAEYTIHGDWEGRIDVGIPTAGSDPSTEDPIVIHEPDAAADLYWLAPALRVDEHVTWFSTSTLSEYGSAAVVEDAIYPSSSYELALSTLNLRSYDGSPYDPYGTGQITGLDLMRGEVTGEQLAILQLNAMINPNPTYRVNVPGCETQGDTLLQIVSANIPSGSMTCARGSGKFTFTNVSAEGPESIYQEATYLDVTVDGVFSIELQGESGGLIGNLVNNVNTQLPANQVLLGGGKEFDVLPTDTLQSGDGTVRFTPNEDFTLGKAILSATVGYGQMKLFPPGPVGDIASCAVGIAVDVEAEDEVSWGTAYGCIADLAVFVASKAPIPPVLVVAGVLKATSELATKIQPYATAAEMTRWYDTEIRFRNIVPVSPPTGGGSGGAAFGWDGTIPQQYPFAPVIIQFDGGRSYYAPVSSPGEAFHITDSGVYVCLAQSLPVLYNWAWGDVFWALNDDPARPVACDPFATTLNTIPAHAKNWIVRFSDSSSYLINDQSEVRVIRDGGCFDYWADRVLVWDYAQPGVLENLYVVPGPSNSAC